MLHNCLPIIFLDVIEACAFKKVKWAYILFFLLGAALENPQDCRPYRPAMNEAAPSKSKIAREFNEAFTKLYKGGYLMTAVSSKLQKTILIYI